MSEGNKDDNLDSVSTSVSSTSTSPPESVCVGDMYATLPDLSQQSKSQYDLVGSIPRQGGSSESGSDQKLYSGGDFVPTNEYGNANFVDSGASEYSNRGLNQS